MKSSRVWRAVSDRPVQRELRQGSAEHQGQRVINTGQGTDELVEQAQHLGQVANLKKLRGGGNYYRIRVGDYRIGLIVEGDAVTFVRFLHRKDIYRYFP